MIVQTEDNGRMKMDFRKAQLEALWAHVMNTEKHWKQARQSTPRGLQLYLNVKHLYRMDQFWYCIDMIRDCTDQEVRPPRYFFPSNGDDKIELHALAQDPNR